MTEVPLPSFRRPPVVETALGLQFHPLPAFTNAHLGAFWKTLGPSWPYVSDEPPLPPQFEQFGDDRPWEFVGSIRLKLSAKPPMRVQIRNAQKNRVVQLQSDRLHYNWIDKGEEGYPRYSTIKPGFENTLQRLRTFVSGEGLGEIRPNQWEVTYVNHFPRGTVWEKPADWGRVFNWRAFFTAAMPGMPLESVGNGWHYLIEPQRGRLHVDFHHGHAGEPAGPEILVLTLTARGPVREGEEGFGVDDGLNLGHSVIVKSFANITSDEVQRYWERIE
jgi:uncharacterized protein (TIGR04255 family)